MSVEENKALARRFFDEVFNTPNRDAAGEIVAGDYVAHYPAFPGGIHGPDGLMQVVSAFRAAFPDLHYTPEETIAEGDRVVVRWTARGTHQGDFQGLPPTGRPIMVTGIDIFRIADGKVVETWISSDLLGLLQQIGAIPGQM